jgi:mycofactocin precursor
MGTAMPDKQTDPAHLDAVDGPDDADLVVEEVLVEEVSIDGMCGVY